MADLEKLVEELSALTILEAAELKDKLEEKWGVTAASGAPMMMAAMPGAAAAAEEEEEKTEFDVVLKEAKELVEGAPATIMEEVSKDAAEDAKSKLEAEGAVVELK